MTSDRWAGLRREYERAGLGPDNALADPIAQLECWLREAHDAGVPEPNAMTLATASPDGEPNARVVLLKALDASGLVFFTNYESAKGRELEANPRAAVVLVWLELERQVRVRGSVARISRAETDAYFAKRPRNSQIGAWASPQSQPVPDRTALEASFAECARRFEAAPLTAPPHWGGLRLRPREIELWQGRQSRMHDRLRYVCDGGVWRMDRLAP